MVFLSYFVFPFKNKTKISGNSKKFSKIIFTKKKEKNESCHQVETHVQKCEVHTYILSSFTFLVIKILGLNYIHAHYNIRIGLVDEEMKASHL